MNPNAELVVSWDWLAAPAVKAAELRATWASLQLRVGSKPVTLIDDLESGSTRRSTYVSLYPLAEWIAFNWWALEAHTRPSSTLERLTSPLESTWRTALQNHWNRHCLRAAGDGYLWPNMYILPQGETTRIVWWGDENATNGRARFLSDGDFVVASDHLMTSLADFVAAVVIRLKEQGVANTPLEQEWSAIVETDDDTAEYCRAAARLGLDPYSDAAKYEREILRVGERLDGTILQDFLDVVEPSAIEPNLEWILNAKDEINKMVAPDQFDLSGVSNEFARSRTKWAGMPPWQKGWAQARALRRLLELPSDRPVAVETLVATYIRKAPRSGLLAIGGHKPEQGSAVILGQRVALVPKRFTIARAVWHLVWNQSNDFLVTAAHTDRQRVERAFAAEFLAPAEGIAERVQAEDALQADEYLIDAVASHFRVTPLLIQHQIENQLII